VSDEAETEIELQTLPLDAWHRARGGRMVPFAGYHMPVQYEGIMAEHLWTRENAGLFDVSHMGQLVLSGEGLDEALEAVLPADVKGLALGRMRYSLSSRIASRSIVLPPRDWVSAVSIASAEK